jgi:hypothetical protein
MLRAMLVMERLSASVGTSPSPALGLHAEPALSKAPI